MEIKKCECGGTPVFEKLFPRSIHCGFVRCLQCDKETKVYTSKQNAVKAWNKGNAKRFVGLGVNV